MKYGKKNGYVLLKEEEVKRSNDSSLLTLEKISFKRPELLAN